MADLRPTYYRCQPIGSKHNLYQPKTDDRFTQVLVVDNEERVIAQFYGSIAKMHAAIFVSSIGGTIRG